MKILDRYVGGSVLASTLFGVVVLSLVLVLGNVFKELLDLLINRDVSLGSVLAFLIYVLPFSLTFTIPWGFLTAVLLVFGRLSADLEITALRASGVSIPRLAAPVVLLGVALSALCLWINIEVAPRSEQKMSRSLYEMATSRPASLFATDEIITEFPDRRIFIGSRRDDGTLENIFLFELNPRQAPLRFIHAREGTLRFDPVKAELLLSLKGVYFERRDPDDPTDYRRATRGVTVQEGTFPISLESLYARHLKGKRLSAHTLPELFQRLSNRELNAQERLRTTVEINKRFSASMACLAFALFAVPLGITAHRRETSAGFGLSLAIAFAYFFFILMAETFSTQAHVFPHFLIWVPNLLFMGLGIALFHRLARS